ncbi:kelch-like protein 14 isoform X2 [Clavelina lepadiformis]|uniref:kelch-like protein 14 isoform X2 n=1 Tax=Clavelina lepadiformis TaxID=159417 RepID=UPI0040432258
MGSNASKTRRVSSSVDDTRILSIPHQHSNEHINLLVEGLVSLRDNCTFCDAIICAFDPDSKEQRKHYTHKCVLAASSGYFREKLGATLPADACSSTMESPVSNETSQTDTATNTSTVILDFPIRTAALEVVLKYMYSAVLDSRLELIPDVLEAAMKLKIASLKRRCLFEIQKEFRLEYFQRIYRLSCQLGISELRDFTLEQAIEKFDLFVDTACFLELTGAEMQELANHRSGFLPNTSVIPELQLFDAILIWEAHNHPDRKDSALKLLKCVHYQKIPQSTLSGYVLTHDIVNKDKELLCIIESILGVDKKRILRRLKEKHNPSTHQLAGGDHGDGVAVTRPAVLVTGGRLYDQLTAQIQELNPKDGSWKEITRMPVTLSHHSVAVKNNVLYVAGGEDTAMAGVRALTSMWSYDPSKNEWETLPDMLHGRAFFCFASLNEHLIAVGGKSSKVIRTSVEKYCILSRRWEFSHCLKQPRFAHAGCVYKHHLYVTGGVVKKSSKVQLGRQPVAEFSADAMR